MRKLLYSVSALAAVAVAAAFVASRSGPAPAQARRAPTAAAAPRPSAPALPDGKRFKVLHIMSYDVSWSEWTVPLFDSFKDRLKDLPVDYRTIEMDVKRNTSAEWKAQVTDRAHAEIAAWKPDLVYTTDDFVQSAVVSRYLNADLPFVFAGVNADPARYHFTGSRNVTGVLEREHIAQTARLLTSIAPSVRRLAVISDAGETWPGVMDRIKAARKDMGLDIVALDAVDTFAQYQEKIASYAGKADAVCTLGIFTLKDDQGKHVPMEQVGRWTFDHCPLPNMSFWDSRLPVGALCAVSVSPTAQGDAAGAMARAILLEGKQPAELPIAPTLRGTPMVNLAVARKLGLNPPSSVLLSAKVSTRLQWE